MCSVSSVVHGLSGFGDDARLVCGDELWFDTTRHPAGQKIKPRKTQNTRKAETASLTQGSEFPGKSNVKK